MGYKYFNRAKDNIYKLKLNGNFLILLIIVITVTGINHFYSGTMILLTTFTLAYLTKGSRRK